MPEPPTDHHETRANKARRIRRWLKRRVKFAHEVLHAATISRWQWWPASLPAYLQPRQRPARPAEPRVAYFIWHFPVLSQTFIRREIEALRKHGISLEVFAEEAEDMELLDLRDRHLLETTRYLLPIDRQRLARYQQEFRRDRRLVYWHVYLFIMSRRYGSTKELERDRALFEQAVYLAGLFRESGIDRVHSPWGDRAGFAAMLAAKLLGIPFSLQVRAHDLHDPIYHPALREMLASADFVITNTQYNRPFIQALMSERATPIHTIYNGVDLAQFDPPRRPAKAGVPTRILCVARLVEQKGLTYLLEACAMLRERRIPFTCAIIGGTEEPLYEAYWKHLETKHRLLQLESSVFFRGAQPFAAVMDAYREADIFVLPCVVARDGRRDITPNAVIEAMAMKLPVVSTPIAGVAEIIEHERSGLLVPAEDPVALADEIERLIRDPGFAATLRENARERIESRFDADKNVLARIDLFATPPAAASLQRSESSMRMSWQES